MRIVLACVLGVACASRVSAAGPTTEQVLEAARTAAVEAESRELLLEVAKRTQELDPEQALREYRAAAGMPVPGDWDALTQLRSDNEVARALAALGDGEGAVELLRAALDRPLGVPAPRGGPPMPEGYASGARAEVLSRVAETLYPLAPDLATETLDRAAELLDKTGTSTAAAQPSHTTSQRSPSRIHAEPTRAPRRS
ncbi:MAG: hypothetical protein PVH68_14130 [Armatimonadota bacterium]|jgi:hypothetical protein